MIYIGHALLLVKLPNSDAHSSTSTLSAQQRSSIAITMLSAMFLQLVHTHNVSDHMATHTTADSGQHPAAPAGGSGCPLLPCLAGHHRQGLAHNRPCTAEGRPLAAGLPATGHCWQLPCRRCDWAVAPCIALDWLCEQLRELRQDPDAPTAVQLAPGMLKELAQIAGMPLGERGAASAIALALQHAC